MFWAHLRTHFYNFAIRSLKFSARFIFTNSAATIFTPIWAYVLTFMLSFSAPPAFAQNSELRLPPSKPSYEPSTTPIFLPTDHVEATPLNSFDDKTYSWPTESIPKKRLEVQGSSLYETLNKYPGVQTQGETSGGSVSIRIRGSGSITRNLILLDGTPLQTQDGLGTNPLLISQETLESVDLIKGPASLFYGADAVGGALNLKTKIYERTTLRFGVESFDKYSSLLGIPLLQSQSSFLQSTVYLEDSKGNFKYDDPSSGEQRRKFNNRSKQRYTLSGKNSLGRVKLSHQIMYAKEQGQSPGPIPTPLRVQFDRHAYLAALGAEMNWNEKSFSTVKLSAIGTQSENLQSGSLSEYDTNKYFSSVSYGYDVASDLNLQVFTDFTYNTFKSKPLVSRKTEGRFEHALILQYQMSETEKLLTGIRYFPDQNELVKSLLLSQDQGAFSLYATYSEGLKHPSFNEMYNDSFGMVPNPNLEVEKSNQIEVGIEKPKNRSGAQFLDPFILKASLFTIHYSDFIQYNFSNTPYSYLNAGEVETRGAEISIDYDRSIYHAYASYSFLNTHIKDEDREVVTTPKHQAYVLLGAMLGPAVLELHTTFWSQYRSTGDEYEPSWIVNDITLRTEGLNDWFLKFGVLNIFEKERILTRFGTESFPEPGRQYFLFAERAF